jgi:hypothetical protein
MTIVFTKGKHSFIHKLGYHTKGYIKGYMSFIQVVKMEPAYQKQNGHENLVPMPRVTSEVIGYQATVIATIWLDQKVGRKQDGLKG